MSSSNVPFGDILEKKQTWSTFLTAGIIFSKKQTFQWQLSVRRSLDAEKLLQYKREQVQVFVIDVIQKDQGSPWQRNWCYYSEVEKQVAICCWSCNCFTWKLTPFKSPSSTPLAPPAIERSRWLLASGCYYMVPKWGVTTTTCRWKPFDLQRWELSGLRQQQLFITFNLSVLAVLAQETASPSLQFCSFEIRYNSKGG